MHRRHEEVVTTFIERQHMDNNLFILIIRKCSARKSSYRIQYQLIFTFFLSFFSQSSDCRPKSAGRALSGQQ